MEVKKLVLGFCALAAVTGEVPQVFGTDSPSGFRYRVARGLARSVAYPSQAFSHESALLHEATGDRRDVFDMRPRMSLNRMLAAAIPNAESREKYAEALEAKVKELKAETAEVAKMGEEEIIFARRACLCERRAHLLREFGFFNLGLICKKIARIDSDLMKAEKALAKASFFVEWRKEKVETLKLALEDAKQNKALVFNGYVYCCELRKRYITAAKQHRASALALHAQQIERLTKLTDSEISKRDYGMKDDVNKVRSGCSFTISDLEEVAGRGVQDLAVLCEAFRRHRYVKHVDWCVRQAYSVLAYDDWRHDYIWFRDNFCNIGSLLHKWLDSYRQIAPGYDSGDDAIFSPVRRLMVAFCPADFLLGDAYRHLYDARFSLRYAEECRLRSAKKASIRSAKAGDFSDELELESLD
jgi:hypothetical protein